MLEAFLFALITNLVSFDKGSTVAIPDINTNSAISVDLTDKSGIFLNNIDGFFDSPNITKQDLKEKISSETPEIFEGELYTIIIDGVESNVENILYYFETMGETYRIVFDNNTPK